MLKRIKRILPCSSFALVFGAGLHLAGAATILNGTATAVGSGNSSTSTFSAVPYATPTLALGADSTEVVVPGVTSTAYQASFSSTLLSSTAVGAGTLSINFVAGTNESYSLAGSEDNLEGTKILSLSLFDDTDHTSVYSYSLTGGTGNAAADSTGGPLIGALAAGDTYTFIASNTVEDATQGFATSSGLGSITFHPTVVPEPTTPALLLIGGGVVLLVSRRRSNAV